MDEKGREKLKHIMDEVKRLQEIVKNGEEQKKVLIKELKARDSFIGKVKAYMGAENFNEMMRLL